MRILIVTDAWAPQINGVVRTLMRTHEELERLGQEVRIISPDLFANLPCPTYLEIRSRALPRGRPAVFLARLGGAVPEQPAAVPLRRLDHFA
jgi:hypothetical protein